MAIFDDLPEGSDEVLECFCDVPEREEAGGDKEKPVPPTGVELVPFSKIEPETIVWLWKERIAQGKLTLLCGDPGLGKSFFTLFAATRVAGGSDWPDGSDPPPPGEVVIVSGEDGPADTIRPRLEAMGAKLDRIHLLKGVTTSDRKQGTSQRQLNLATDIASLRKMLEQHPKIRLIVIDPISQYLGKTDSHNNAEVRTVLGELANLAEAFNVAILCVTHLSKGNGRAIYRPMGSMAFVAVARTAFVIVKSDQDDKTRYILPIKNNLAPSCPALAYQIVDGRMEWSPAPVEVDLEGLLAGPPNAPPRKRKLHEAVNYLRELLQCRGVIPSDDLETEMENAGFSPATTRRAKTQLGTNAHKNRGRYGGWLVSLPQPDPDPLPDPVEPLERLEPDGWSDPDQPAQAEQGFPGDSGDQEWT